MKHAFITDDHDLPQKFVTFLLTRRVEYIPLPQGHKEARGRSWNVGQQTLHRFKNQLCCFRKFQTLHTKLAHIFTSPNSTHVVPDVSGIWTRNPYSK
jgi:hypothetical protein